jgi:hypothetical protein
VSALRLVCLQADNPEPRELATKNLEICVGIFVDSGAHADYCERDSRASHGFSISSFHPRNVTGLSAL